MKNKLFILIPLFILFTSFIDRIPSVEFVPDNYIRQNGIKITLIDSISEEPSINRTILIDSEKDDYLFRFPSNSYKILIKFKDSTEVYSTSIYNSKYKTYSIKIVSKQVKVTDITTQSRNTRHLKLILFSLFGFLLIKIFPVFLIIYPKDKLKFLKYFGIAQIIYFIAFSALTYLTYFPATIFLSIIVYVFSCISDYQILNRFLIDGKGVGRIVTATIGSVILSLGFGIIFWLTYTLIVI